MSGFIGSGGSSSSSGRTGKLNAKYVLSLLDESQLQYSGLSVTINGVKEVIELNGSSDLETVVSAIENHSAVESLVKKITTVPLGRWILNPYLAIRTSVAGDIQNFTNGFLTAGGVTPEEPAVRVYARGNPETIATFSFTIAGNRPTGEFKLQATNNASAVGSSLQEDLDDTEWDTLVHNTDVLASGTSHTFNISEDFIRVPYKYLRIKLIGHPYTGSYGPSMTEIQTTARTQTIKKHAELEFKLPYGAEVKIETEGYWLKSRCISKGGSVPITELLYPYPEEPHEDDEEFDCGTLPEPWVGINTLSDTVSFDKSAVILRSPSRGNTRFVGVGRPITGDSWSVEFKVSSETPQYVYQAVGMFAEETQTGKKYCFGKQFRSENETVYSLRTGPAFTEVYEERDLLQVDGPDLYIRAVRDGNTLTFSSSKTGRAYSVDTTYNLSDWEVGELDRIGVWLWPEVALGTACISCDSYRRII